MGEAVLDFNASISDLPDVCEPVRPTEGTFTPSARGSAPEPAPRADGNPFVAMAQGAPTEVVPRALGAQAAPLEVDLEPSLEVLTSLGVVEAGLPQGTGEGFNKVRKGSLLLAVDAKGVNPRGELPKDLAKVLHTLTSQASSREAKADALEVFARLAARFLAGERANVQAQIQRALRESYLLQGELLLDRVEKLKSLNEHKKRVRDKIRELRGKQTLWAVATGKDPNFVAKEGVRYERLDESGRWTEVLTTEEDLRAWEARIEEQKLQPPQSLPDVSVAFFSGESRLSAAERKLLDAALEGRPAHWLIENRDALFAATQKLNEAETQYYMMGVGAPDGQGLIPRFKTHDNRLLADLFVEGLNRVQKIYLFARSVAGSPIEAPHFKVGDVVGVDAVTAGASAGVAAAGLAISNSVAAGVAAGSWAGPFGMVIGGVFGFIGGLFGAAGAGVAANEWASSQPEFTNFSDAMRERIEDNFQECFDEVLGLLGMAPEDLNPSSARAVMPRLRLLASEVDSALSDLGGGAPPKVGEPRTLTLVPELNDYIKELEDRLNGLGDDGELTSVEVQGALEKQTQLITMITNISKVWHETDLALVRTIDE